VKGGEEKYGIQNLGGFKGKTDELGGFEVNTSQCCFFLFNVSKTVGAAA